MDRVEVARTAKTGIEREGPQIAGFGSRPIPFVRGLDEAERTMRFGEMGIHLERTKSGSLGTGHGDIGVHAAEGVAQIEIGIRDTSVRGGVERIEIESMLEAFDGFLETGLVALVPEEARAGRNRRLPDARGEAELRTASVPE